MSRESTNSRSDQLGNQMLAHGHPVSEADQLKALDAVDHDALTAMARRVFASPLSLAAIGPLSQLESYERISDRLRLN